MKLVDLKTLLAQPAGTIFAPYQSVDVEHLMVFGGTSSVMKDSFTCAQLSPYWADLPAGGTQSWIEFWQDHMEAGEEHAIDWLCWGRDSGYFEDGAQFVLLDAEDVKGLFLTLAKILTKVYGVEDLGELLEKQDGIELE